VPQARKKRGALAATPRELSAASIEEGRTSMWLNYRTCTVVFGVTPSSVGGKTRKLVCPQMAFELTASIIRKILFQTPAAE
jgi:hypothetical protein